VWPSCCMQAAVVGLVVLLGLGCIVLLIGCLVAGLDCMEIAYQCARSAMWARPVRNGIHFCFSGARMGSPLCSHKVRSGSSSRVPGNQNSSLLHPAGFAGSNTLNQSPLKQWSLSTQIHLIWRKLCPPRMFSLWWLVLLYQLPTWVPGSNHEVCNPGVASGSVSCMWCN